jgi:hypothetical protein
MRGLISAGPQLIRDEAEAKTKKRGLKSFFKVNRRKAVIVQRTF